jgi:hypothetical protein
MKSIIITMFKNTNIKDTTDMLTANRLGELPLEVRIEIAKLDMEAYIRMWILDLEFRVYANMVTSINWFIDQFVVTKMSDGIVYKLGSVSYYVCNSGKEEWRKNGILHRENRPAALDADCSHSYWINDKLHREDGPAIIYSDGSIEYWINGEIHRLDGPAVICANGDEWWYINDKRHRDDGPAVVHTSGYKAYYQHGKRHRLDGPAVIHENGSEEYYEYGVRIYK